MIDNIGQGTGHHDTQEGATYYQVNIEKKERERAWHSMRDIP